MKTLTIFALALFFLTAQPVIAAICPSDAIACTGDDIVRIFGRIANWVGAVIAIVATVMILYAAYLFLTGSEEKIKTARSALLWGIIGIVVAFSAFGIVQFVESLLKP